MEWDFGRRMWGDLRAPLYRNAIFLMANTAAGLAFGFFFWLVAARFYTDDNIGRAATLISLVSLLATLANLGFGIGLVRYIPEAKDPRRMVNACLTISALVAVFVALAFLLGSDIWAPSLFFVRNNLWFALTFVLFPALLAVGPTIDAALLARRKGHFIFGKGLVLGVRVPMPVLLVGFLGVFGIFGSFGLAYLIATGIALFAFLPRAEPGYRPAPALWTDEIGGLFRFSFGNYVASLISAVPAGLLPLLIGNVLGPADAGFFYIAWSLAGMLYVIPGALASSLYAEGSQVSADFARDTRKAVRLTVVLLAPAIVFFLVLGNYVLLLYGGAYSDAGFGLLRLLALAGGFVALNSLYVTKLRVDKRILPIIAFSAATAAVMIAVSWALFTTMGIAAVGVAQLVSQGGLSVYVAIAWGLERARRA